MSEHSGPGLAFPLAAAHTLECALKAYLSRDGNDGRLKEPNLRHNIKRLWETCVNEGLDLPDPPHWALNLSGIHDKPYYLRYSTGVHAIATPAPGPTAIALSDVVAKVRDALLDYRKAPETRSS
ncbi:hypothetical protein [Rubripirellula amarantea]|nr:hypothetical protein [Rubripirellula amarantea]